MNFRPSLGRPALFALIFLFALIVLLPLRLALDWFGFDRFGLAAREATGSIWLGALSEAQLGPAPIGDVEVRLNRLPLLIGRTRLSVERQALESPLSGAVGVSGEAFGLDDFSGQLRLGAAFAPLPVGSVELDDVSVRFAGGLCESADGRVKALLAREVAGLSFASGLSGTARCQGGMLFLPLASQSGTERLDLSLGADGRYRAEFTVRAGDPTLRAQLVAAGFRPSGDGLAIRLQGDF